MSSPPSINTIEIHAFRGNRPKDNKPTRMDDERLERYGHVGISFDNGTKIEGFNPLEPPDISREDFLERLDARESFPGQVKDDTELFARARGFRSKYREEKRFLDGSICLEIRERLENDRKNSAMDYKRYSLPPKERGGVFEPNTWNCLTYPLSLGMPMTLFPYQGGWLHQCVLEKDEYFVIKYECR